MSLGKCGAVEKVVKKATNLNNLEEGGTRSETSQELQALTALRQEPALKTNVLMERICEPANLNSSYKRVYANKGAPGVDKMTVQDLKEWMSKNKDDLTQKLLDGTYQPQPVRKVDIPKPDGGTRQLGIPTVVDRLVQQAIAQVLTPIFDPDFSESSYGFRPGRSAHQALIKAQEFVKAGKKYVVDIDLERFFDRVNHDVLMDRVSRKIFDKRVLKLIGKFLRAGIMEDGLATMRTEGTPQGGPLSPLLSNILLDDLDKELERRGHSFCRYADDCNVYVGSQKAGERVMENLVFILEKKLRLRVNQRKSAVSPSRDRKYLGYVIWIKGMLLIAKTSIERFKDKIKAITKRNRGVKLEKVIAEINKIIPGWVNYFKLASCKGLLTKLDAWIRRKIRCYRIKQFKRSSTIARNLKNMGVPERDAWNLASSGRGWWRLSNTPQVAWAMNLKWFDEKGLKSLLKSYMSL